MESGVAGVSDTEKGEEGDFDFVGGAEEFEENADALGTREDACDGALLANQGAGDDVHGLTWLNGGGDGDGFLFIHRGAEFGDDVVGDGGAILHEVKHLADESGAGDVAHLLAAEAGEEVAGEEGFNVPDFATDGFFLVAEAGAERLEAGGAEMVRSEVFRFGLPADDAPFFRAVGRENHGLVENGREQRHNFLTAGMPLGEFGETEFVEVAVTIVTDEGQEEGETLTAAFEVGSDFLTDKAGGKFFEFGLGSIVVTAVAADIDLSDGSEGAEDFESLAGRAFADVEAGDEGVQGDGVGGNEEEAVDFTHTFGHAEHLYGVDEEVDDADFDRSKRSLFPGRGRGGAAGGGSGHRSGKGRAECARFYFVQENLNKMLTGAGSSLGNAEADTGAAPYLERNGAAPAVGMVILSGLAVADVRLRAPTQMALIAKPGCTSRIKPMLAVGLVKWLREVDLNH